MTDLFLLADLGGTNTRVGLADANGLLANSSRSFANEGFTGLAALLRAYLDDVQPGPITGLCAGVAGPVKGSTAQLTNHKWFIDAADLGAATGAPHVHLINDLQAQGCALDDLSPKDTTPLFSGTPAGPDATRLVMGLGTGCNVAVVHRINGTLYVPPAESGHTTLPHIPGLSDLLTHLATRHPHLPIESALSGPGLTNIHAWHSGHYLPPDQIIAAARTEQGEATKTLTLFAQLLGTVAGNLCLSHLPMGGLYLIGGTARAVAPFLKPLGFHTTFIAKGPYTDILQAIPVHLITGDTAALRGCARHLRQILPHEAPQ